MYSCTLLIGFGVSAALATAAHTQDASEITRQRALVDSLLPQWHAVKRELVRADSVDRARRQGREIAVDTAVIGPFTVVAPENEAAEHFRNVRAAVRERAAMLEGIQPGSRMPLFVQRDVGTENLRFQAQRSNGIHLRIFGASPRVRARFTRRAVDNAIAHYLPPGIRTWLGSTELGRGRERANVYREMATAPVAAVRACHRGDIGSCIAALGLNAQDSNGESFGHAARASLLLHALSAGEPGGIARMDGAGASSPADALQRASRMGLPQLVQDWRSDLAREYVSYAGLSRASAAALFWAAVSLLLALRSTRRRAE